MDALTIFDQNHKVKYHLVHSEAETVKNEVYGGVVTLDLVISSILLPLRNHGWILKKIDFSPHLSLSSSSHGKGGCCNSSGCDLWIWLVFVIYGFGLC